MIDELMKEEDASISRQRETRFVTLGIEGLPGFTELVLTPDEEKRLEELKSILTGTKVNISPENYNDIGSLGEITDIRVVVNGYGEVYPCALVKWQSHGLTFLRALSELINADNQPAIDASLLLDNGQE